MTLFLKYSTIFKLIVFYSTIIFLIINILESCVSIRSYRRDSQDLKKSKGAITLIWRTESELDNYGFNIYRSDSEDGPFEKINKEIIPGHGTTNEPHEYKYVDTDCIVGKKYYYYLEEVDLKGYKKKISPVIQQIAE